MPWYRFPLYSPPLNRKIHNIYSFEKSKIKVGTKNENGHFKNVQNQKTENSFEKDLSK
jgi:hypothetical protein